MVYYTHFIQNAKNTDKKKQEHLNKDDENEGLANDNVIYLIAMHNTFKLLTINTILFMDSMNV